MIPDVKPILPFLGEEEKNRLLSLEVQARWKEEGRRWFALALERARYSLFLSGPGKGTPQEAALLQAHRALLEVEEGLWKDGGYGFRGLDLLLLWRRMEARLLAPGAEALRTSSLWGKKALEALIETTISLGRFLEGKDLSLEGERWFLEGSFPQERALHAWLGEREEAFSPGVLEGSALRYDLETLSLWYEEMAWAVEDLPEEFRTGLPYGEGGKALTEAWKALPLSVHLQA